MAPAIVLTALAIVILRVASDHHSIDFTYIWNAGRMWADGLDPYGPDFTRLGNAGVGHAVFGSDAFWVYPPQWSGMSMILADMPFRSAARWWDAINIVLLVASLAIFRHCADLAPHPPTPVVRALVLFHIATCAGTGLVFGFGQTGGWVLFGFALLTLGWMTRRRWIVGAAVTIFMLKPPVGLAVAICVAARRRYRPAVGAATAITIMASIPAYWQMSPSSALVSVGRMLDNMEAYGTLLYNLPATTTGIGVGLSYIMPASVPTPIYSIACGAAVAAFLYIVDRDDRHLSMTMPTIVAVTFVIVPLHVYDLVAAPAIALFARAWRTASKIALAASLLLLYRPRGVARLWLGGDEETLLYGQAVVVMLSNILLAAAVLLQWWPRRGVRPSPVSDLVTGRTAA